MCTSSREAPTEGRPADQKDFKPTVAIRDALAKDPSSNRKALAADAKRKVKSQEDFSRCKIFRNKEGCSVPPPHNCMGKGGPDPTIQHHHASLLLLLHMTPFHIMPICSCGRRTTLPALCVVRDRVSCMYFRCWKPAGLITALEPTSQVMSSVSLQAPVRSSLYFFSFLSAATSKFAS